MATKPDGRSGVEFEPHLRAGRFRADPSDAHPPPVPSAKEPDVDHSVWDEPERLTVAPPAGAVTYAAWLETGRLAASPRRAWLLALALAAVAGPWSILGALVGSIEGGSMLGLLTVVVFGPVVEEICKVSAVMIVIERRPFRFTHRAQVLLACLASGLVFALIENQFYFHFSETGPTPQLIAWRNSVCLVLHAGCSLIAGLGLVRMWEASMRARVRPRPEHAATAITVACVIHGAYNLLATLIDPVFK